MNGYAQGNHGRPIGEQHGAGSRMYGLGQRLQGNQQSYRLVAELGPGRTAVTFRAQVEGTEDEYVAIKAMRTEISQDEQDRFYNEAHTLALLQGKSEIPVRYYEMVRDADPPFIVEELIRGEKLPNLLAVKRHLDERTALQIGWQFCELLHILHTDLRLTYTDLKLENLWWDEKGQTLRVTDWNTLGSDLGRIPDDLWRFSRYLYRLLVGGTLEMESGLRGKLGRHPPWEALSLGTRRILSKALHVHSVRRYQSAEEMRDDLQEQWWRWTQAGPLLLELAEGIVQNEEPERNLRLAQELADMAGRVPEGVQPVDRARLARLKEAIERELSQKEGRKASVVELIQAGSYEAARQLAEDILSDDPSDIHTWRWRELARAGRALRDRFRPVRERAVEAVRAMERETWARARDALAALGGEFGGLVAEAQVRGLIVEAERHTQEEAFGDAANSYAEAHKALQAVPDDPLVARGEPENQITYQACVLDGVGDLIALEEKTRQQGRWGKLVERVVGLLKNPAAYGMEWDNALLREVEEALAAVTGLVLQDPASRMAIREAYARRQREAGPARQYGKGSA